MADKDITTGLTKTTSLTTGDYVYGVDGGNSRGILFQNLVASIQALGMDTSGITSGTFADARIAQTNVTQHEAALSILLAAISDASANGRSLVSAASYAAMRTLLDLEAGTDFYSIAAADAAFQALSTNLADNLGLQTIWMPAVAMTSRATSGAAAGSYDSGAADISIATFDFDTTAQEFVHFQIAMPESWNEGTITFIPYWTNTAGLTTETVEWKLQAYAVSNDDALNATFSNSVTSGDTWIAQNDLHVGPISGALTIDGTPAAGDAVLFELSRNVAGTDNMTGDALLIGIKILYTVNAGTDN